MRTAKTPEILHESMQKGCVKFVHCLGASNFRGNYAYFACFALGKVSDSICNFFGSYAPDASIAEQRLSRSRRCNRLLAVEPMVWVHSWKTLLFLYLLVLGTTSYSWLILGHSGRAAAARRHFLPRRKNAIFDGLASFRCILRVQWMKRYKMRLWTPR